MPMVYKVLPGNQLAEESPRQIVAGKNNLHYFTAEGNATYQKSTTNLIYLQIFLISPRSFPLH